MSGVMSDVADKVKNTFKAATDQIDVLAGKYPKLYFAVLIIGTVGVLVAIYFSATGQSNPFSVTSLFSSLGGRISIGVVGAIALPCLGIMYMKQDDKESKAYQYAEMLLPLIVLPVIFSLANMMGGQLAQQILNPYTFSINFSNSFSIPLPLPLDMGGNFMIKKIITYGAGGCAGLFYAQVSKSKNKEYYEAGAIGVASLAGVALVVFSILALLYGKGANPILALAGAPLLPHFFAAAVIGFCLAKYAGYQFFISNPHTQLTSEELEEAAQEQKVRNEAWYERWYQEWREKHKHAVKALSI